MTKTTKRIIWITVAAIVTYYLVAMGVIGPKEWASAAGTRTYTRHDGWVSWVDKTPHGLSVCTKYPNGVWAGWIDGYSNHGPPPDSLLRYTLVFEAHGQPGG